MSLELNEVVPALDRHPQARFAAAGLAGRQELGFAQLRRHVMAAASLLQQRGVGPGSHVGILARNSPEWLVADLACLALGAVTVPFDRAENWGDPGEMIGRYDLALLVTDAWPAADRVLAPKGLLDAPHGELRPYAYRPDECSTVKFSSGSSARPKAIEATAAHFDHHARHIGAMFPTGPGDLFLVIAPLSTWLQRFIVHLSILTGADVVLARPETALLALERERPTFVIAVPRLLEAVHLVHRQRAGTGDAAGLAQLWGGRLRYLWTGSAPLDPAILGAYVDAGLPLYEGYGMSETGMIAKNHPAAHRPGSVGRVFPEKHVRFDADGQILVQSDFHANSRYWRGEGAAFRPGKWVATGDVGRLDADGYLYVDGRLKEMIVLGNGRKVFPDAVEAHLRSHPAIADCAVIGHDGDHLVAAIQTADPAMPDRELAAAVASACEALPVHQRVLDFFRLGNIGFEDGFRTANGKLKRAAVADHYARLRSEAGAA